MDAQEQVTGLGAPDEIGEVASWRRDAPQVVVGPQADGFAADVEGLLT